MRISCAASWDFSHYDVRVQRPCPGARVTDEIFLFLFRIEPLFVSTFGPDSEIDLDFGYDHKKIVADAEKAFVSLLQPHYNTVKFSQYPKGNDGLYDSKLDRYAYHIGEAITFNTAHGKIKGGRNRIFGGITNEADFIFVDKETSRLFIAGKDFDEDQKPNKSVEINCPKTALPDAG